MCLIIDTNKLSVFFDPEDTSLKSIRECLLGQRKSANESAKWTVGGTKYRKEIGRVGAAKRIFIELSRRGRIDPANDLLVDDMEESLMNAGLRSVNDEVIIALALVSGCRAIVTDDIRLIEDFKNFLKPPGRIISKNEHIHIVRECCGS